MRNSDLKAFIGSKDYEKSLSFYTALGFRVNWREEKLAEIETPGGRFLLQDYYNQEWCDNTMLHLSVDDVDAWYEHIKSVIEDTGYDHARISPPKLENYGAQVSHLWDPSGILWHVAEYES